MLLTEEEAKERWCPFRRLPVIADCHCIASQCMAWRWSDWRKIVIASGGYDQTEAPTEPQMGYCGLAGNSNLASDIASQQVAAKDREAQ